MVKQEKGDMNIEQVLSERLRAVTELVTKAGYEVKNIE